MSISSVFVKCCIAGALITSVFACKKDSKSDLSVNFFSVEKDIELGTQLRNEINNNPAEYPVLKEADYPAAYGHLRRIRDNILNSGKVKYKDKFAWEVYIIKDDNTLNAFCAPGGFIYVYTGIIKYLDNEAQLAGVLGHEIAHADRRHSTDRLTTQYGVTMLLDVVLGKERSKLADMAASLAILSYSRSQESESDAYSVEYLCPTSYSADGAAGFFEKIVASGGSSTPAFLSTHPDPGNRVVNIKDKKTTLGCTGSETTGSYAAFKSSLP